ncbi:MAG: lactate utilization protein [Atribacterota bacterium]|jgi:L-lactate utilization protein LutC
MNTHKDIENKNIQICRENFLKNHFNFILANHTEEARDIVINEIIPKLNIKTASWGDSITVMETGILEELNKSKNINFIQTFDEQISREEIIQRRRDALGVDLFITGSNSLTEKGQLVNLDMVGNRIAPMIFGPKHVIIIVGKNKIVSNIPEAMDRIRNYVAPRNAKRHQLKTPCVLTGKCMDCQDNNRICNAWSIIEKSYPPGRITIILINKDLGL